MYYNTSKVEGSFASPQPHIISISVYGLSSDWYESGYRLETDVGNPIIYKRKRKDTMPRGSTNYGAVDEAYLEQEKKKPYVKVSDRPQRFYFEGIGDAVVGNYGLQTPIYVATEDLIPKEFTANQGLYRAFKEQNIPQWRLFEIHATKETLKNADGSDAYSSDGTLIQKNIYHFKILEEEMDKLAQLKFTSNSSQVEGGEVNIDDIPF